MSNLFFQPRGGALSGAFPLLVLVAKANIYSQSGPQEMSWDELSHGMWRQGFNALVAVTRVMAALRGYRRVLVCSQAPRVCLQGCR